MKIKRDSKGFKPRPCAAYDDEGVCIAVGDSVNDLAKQLHVDPSAVSKGCKKHNGMYAYIMTDEELEQYERDERKRDARKAEKVCRNAENT